MPFNAPLSFTSADYTDRRPSFSVGTDAAYDKDLKFASKTTIIKLDNINYGLGIFQIQYSGNIDYASLAFEDPNSGKVSVGTEIDGLYKLSFPGTTVENIFKNEETSGTRSFYVITNADPNLKSQYLKVTISVASKSPTTADVNLTYTCPEDLYEYETGLHTYSPYDAIAGSSTLTTKLYSRKPISSWDNGTYIYQNPYFTNPALPYFYGYGTKVYQVGTELDRAYGTKTEYEVTKRGLKKPSVKEITIGPKSTYDSVNETSQACFTPTMEGLGKVRKVYNNTDLDQPQQYRYYMGYDASNERQSNDSVFTQYVFNTKKHYPITGAQHALEKLTSGAITGYNPSWKIKNWQLGITGLGLSVLIPGAIQAIATAASSVSAYFSGLVGPFMPSLITLGPGLTAFLGAVMPWVGAALVLFFLAKAIFGKKKERWSESCKLFLHHFSSTPYFFCHLSIFIYIL